MNEDPTTIERHETTGQDMKNAAQETTSGRPANVPEVTSQRDAFLGQCRDKLMIGHATVQLRQLRVDGSTGFILLTHADLPVLRYAGGVLMYGEDGREWKFVSEGRDGTESDSPACIVLSVTPYPLS